MALKWMSCFAALAASAGLAVAQAPASVGPAGPRSDAPAPASHVVPASDADPAPAALPMVLPPPGPGSCLAGAPCNGALFEKSCDCDEGYMVRAYADYLLWFYKRDHVPVLFGSIPPALAGVNPLPPGSINPVFGGDHDSLDYRGQSGARFGVEGWFDACQHVGLDVDYFQMERGALHAGAQSGPNGLPIVGPTFFDPTTSRETLILFADPGVRTADLALSSETRFWGVEANVRTRIPSVFSDRTALLLGFRHVQFDQSLDVAGSSLAISGDPRDVSLSYQDSLWVHDRFYGPQIGVDAESTYHRLFLNVKAKFAVGEMDETVHINGSTTLLSPPGSTVQGGVLAQRSNIGAYGRSVFTFLPELTVNTGLQVSDHVRLSVGYNMIYIDKLQRVGPTIDGVDATQVPSLQSVPNANANRPAFQFSDGRFWAQGLTTGLEFRY